MSLIEAHADELAKEAVDDLATNPHTSSFHASLAELEARVFATYHNLGKWIGNPSREAVAAEYESWGALRFNQGIPLSEIVYALNRLKHHLRRFVRDHGLVEFSGDRVAYADLVGVQLYSIQELNYMVDEFFDRAMYHLAVGYEREAQRQRNRDSRGFGGRPEHEAA
jgi:hypothetical protein